MGLMEKHSFLKQLIRMYESANAQAAILDADFMVLWCSAAWRSIQPPLEQSEGAKLLLEGHDLQKIRLTIASTGSAICADSALFPAQTLHLFSFSVAGTDYFLMQPAPSSYQGTGMRPEGIARTLTTFSSQYRTPLTIIFSMLSLLQKSVDSLPKEKARDDALSYLDTINQNALRVLRSCEWISLYTRLASGLMKPRIGRLDIYQFLDEFFSAAAALIEPTGIPLSYHIPQESLIMLCDTELLSAVILNILSNSCRFTQKDNYIDIKVRQHARHISITITDRGQGVPEEALARVFDPYFSYEQGGHSFAGNGLGLAIARLAVESMGGSITLTSLPGKGTTVLFALPITDDPSATPCIYSTTLDYLEDPFSNLNIALCDGIPISLQRKDMSKT